MIREGLVYTCSGCGEPLQIEPGKMIATCKVCGNTNAIPKMVTPERQESYDRAMQFRRNGDFEKAKALCMDLINDFGDDAELYWSLLLCKFGVRFVEDPVKGGLHPTIQRMQNTDVLEDPDYKSALQYASADQEVYDFYKKTGEEIHEIQSKYFKIVGAEKPFDVFISYKETDLNGNRTVDSVQAEKVYNELTKEGYKVFYSRITLEDHMGEEYEPYIFAALNSAKIMLVVGSRAEYVNATWVKNEWERFLQLIRAGQDKKIFCLCVPPMRMEDFPDAIGIYQGQDMSVMGAELTVLHNVKRVIPKGKSEAKSEYRGETVESLMDRVKVELEDRKFETVQELLDKILNMQANNAEAYLYKLLAVRHVTSLQELAASTIPFDDLEEYRRIKKFTNDVALIRQLDEMNRDIKVRQKEKKEQEARAAAVRRQEEERKRQYDMATSLMDSYENKPVEEAIKVFKSLGDYRDAQQKIEECYAVMKNNKNRKIRRIVLKLFFAAAIIAAVLFIAQSARNVWVASETSSEAYQAIMHESFDGGKGLIVLAISVIAAFVVGRIVSEITLSGFWGIIAGIAALVAAFFVSAAIAAVITGLRGHVPLSDIIYYFRH